jgi:uncharacterized protein (DUF362 family)
MKKPRSNKQSPKFNRRQFLKLLGAASASILINGCQVKEPPIPTPLPATLIDQTPTPVQSPSPFPTQTETSIPATSTPVPKVLVATTKVTSYDPVTIRTEMERMLDSIGGLSDIIKPGARVGVKVNLTGGTWWDTPDKPPSPELFVTHPVLAGELCKLLKDSGASKIYIMDGLGDERNFEKWGYNAMAGPLGVELIDLCKPNPFPDFIRFPVGGGYKIYDSFLMNGILKEIDILISVAKMKCHSTTGVTLSLKNLIGLPPISKYRRSDSDNNKSSFHGNIKFDTRLPNVIIDLNQAKPINLAIIDGIFTAEAGAGPWDKGLSQVKPGVLVLGKDPVAVDAVATAIMGFNPEAASRTLPFTGGENHLILANQAGLGTNRLSEIGIDGPSIADLLFKFKPVTA